MSPGVAIRHAESVRHIGGFGIEEIPGLFSEDSVSMNSRMHNIAMKMGVDRSNVRREFPAALSGL